MRALVAGLALALLIVSPVAAAPEAPSLTIETPGPYHYGDVIVVEAHGDYPGRPGDYHARTAIRLDCFQDGSPVWSEFIYSPIPEWYYTLHLGPDDPSVATSLWDLNGGGLADCTVDFYRIAHSPTWYSHFDIHVEA
jgi:hypothetical protein